VIEIARPRRAVEDADVSTFSRRRSRSRHEDHDFGQARGHPAGDAGRGEDQGQGRRDQRRYLQPRHRRDGIVPNIENIGLRTSAWTDDVTSDRRYGRTTQGIWRSATVPPAPGWRTRRATGRDRAETIAQEGNAESPAPARPPQHPAAPMPPQIASVGLTEAKAREAGYELKGATSRSSATARHRARRARGLHKRFRRQDRELLGAHMIGAEGPS